VIHTAPLSGEVLPPLDCRDCLTARNALYILEQAMFRAVDEWELARKLDPDNTPESPYSLVPRVFARMLKERGHVD
jgi:hypothetical protein